MNIHEHQAKDILKDFGAPTTEGVIIFNSEGIIDKIKNLNTCLLYTSPSPRD